jgi:hypothetical protein
MGRRPIENRKEVLTVRVDPTLLAEFRRAASNAGPAVEEAIRLWLARRKRQAGKDPLAQHLAPPSRRETAARKGAG